MNHAHQDIKSITGLRAFSVIAVLLYHVNSGILPGGFVGVDFFFVISGFVVALSVSNHTSESFVPYILAFYRRRIVRILPALYVFTIVTLLVTSALIPSSFLYNKSKITAVFAMVGLSNFILLRDVGDYFAPTPEYNFFTHTWSLAIEEQYYFIFPVIGYFIFSATGRRVSRGAGTVALVVLAIASLAACAVLTSRYQSAAFYMLPTRFWELGAGALLYVLTKTGLATPRSVPRHVDILLSAAVGALMIASVILPRPNLFPWPYALLPVGAALVAIYWTTTCRSLLSKALSSTPLVYVGKISYSVYLWHWGAVVLARWTVGLEDLKVQILVILVSICLGVLSYHFVENFVKNSRGIRELSITRFYFLSTSACAVAGLFAVSLAMFGSQLSISKTRDTDTWYPYIDKAPISLSSCEVGIKKTRGEFVRKTSAFPKGCAKPVLPRIVSIGDSHSGAYERMLVRVAADENRPIDVYEVKGCALFRFQQPDSPLAPPCASFRSNELGALLSALQPGDVLFLPGLKVPRFRDQGGDTIKETTALPAASRYAVRDRREVDERLAELSPFLEKGIKVVVEDIKPVMKNAPFLCADWYTRSKEYCAGLDPVSLAETRQRGARATAALHYLHASEGRITVWRPMTVLCENSVCSPYRDGKPLYFDGDHLSGYANDLLEADFRSTLRNLEGARF